MRSLHIRVLILSGLMLSLCACGGGGSTDQLTMPPSVLGVSPASGAVVGGTPITIAGERFLNTGVGVGEVLIGSVHAGNVIFVDDETITCVTPEGVLGPATVEVVKNHGTGVLPDGFTYFPAPTLLSCTPGGGPKEGHALLRLVGTGFTRNQPGDTEVVFGDLYGGRTVIPVELIDDTQMDVYSPSFWFLGTYDLSVRNRNGVATLPLAFECAGPPTLTGVTPAAGPAGGGTRIELTGADLGTESLDVLVGGVPATEVSLLTQLTVACRTPPGTPGVADVSIRTVGGTATLENAFTYETWWPLDTLFPDQWHLQNTGQHVGAVPGEDAKVAGAWIGGYTGEGVQVAIIDDGLEIGHEDLADNVVPGESYDYVDLDTDPTGGDHGTSVAGVAAARGGNSIGVTGVAPLAGLAGYNAIEPSIMSDATIADAHTRNLTTNDIYNGSFGIPTWYGYVSAAWVVRAAIAQGIANGRGGLGAVYVRAAGNEGEWDGNANNEEVLTVQGILPIGAVGPDGTSPAYSTPGANVLLCAPTSGSATGPSVTTTDRTGAIGYDPTNYTATFGGTSSAAPLVSGVIALMLQVRPELRWWDVPLILAETARRNDTVHADWSQNGAGYWVNHWYGFGVVDAAPAVEAARLWTGPSSQNSQTVSASVGTAIPDADPTGISASITIAPGGAVSSIHRIVVTVTLPHDYTTDLGIELTSPDGTVSRLAVPFYVDSGPYPANIGTFSSWRHLGESPTGTWTLRVSDHYAPDTGSLDEWSLTFEGAP